MLSKLGVCSRSQGVALVRAGRVTVDGRRVLDPGAPTRIDARTIALDGMPVAAARPVYILLNKPRGLVVSAADEQGRATVYAALADAGLPWLGAVGRLDKASEGLLLLSNDTQWAAGITSPATHVDKTYHVQIDRVPDAALLDALRAGVEDAGEFLRAKRARVLRSGQRHAWLELVLDEGRNRHIRRLLAAHEVKVLRLVRTAIGTLALGDVPKGQWRHLEPEEVQALARRSD